MMYIISRMNIKITVRNCKAITYYATGFILLQDIHFACTKVKYSARCLFDTTHTRTLTD